MKKSISDLSKKFTHGDQLSKIFIITFFIAVFNSLIFYITFTVKDNNREKDVVQSSWSYKGIEDEWESFDRRMLRHMRKQFDIFGEKIWLGQVPKVQTIEREKYGEYCEEVWHAIEVETAIKIGR